MRIARKHVRFVVGSAFIRRILPHIVPEYQDFFSPVENVQSVSYNHSFLLEHSAQGDSKRRRLPGNSHHADQGWFAKRGRPTGASTRRVSENQKRERNKFKLSWAMMLQSFFTKPIRASPCVQTHSANTPKKMYPLFRGARAHVCVCVCVHCFFPLYLGDCTDAHLLPHKLLHHIVFGPNFGFHQPQVFLPEGYAKYRTQNADHKEG